MSDYITNATLDFDGIVVDGFRKFEENEFEVGKTVEMARKTGFAKITPRYGFKLEYPVPSVGEPDFSPLIDSDGVVSVFRDGGSKIVFRGCRLLKKNPGGFDGKEENVVTLEFMAAERDPAL